MGDENPVVDAPIRVPAPTPSSVASIDTAEVAAPTFAGTLLGVQRSAGNRAAVRLANRIVQRDPDPPVTTSGDQSKNVSGAGPDTAQIEPYKGIQDIPLELRTLERMVFDPLSNFTWDAVGQRANLPLDLFKPKFGVIVTATKQIIVDRFGYPHQMYDKAAPQGMSERFAFIIQMTTGETWQLWTRDGFVDEARYATKLPPVELEGVEPGNSIFYDLIPDVTMDAAQIRQVEEMIRSTQAAVRRAAGPPDWAKATHKSVRQRRGGSGTTGDGPGAGRTGQGTGGGGESETTQGAGETGVGPGIADATDEQATGGGGKSTEKAPTATGPPLQGPVDIKLEMSTAGYPRLRITIDRASTTVPLRKGEDETALDQRIDQAIEALQQSRDPNAVVGVRDGAKSTGFGAPKKGEVGERRSGEATREQATGAKGMATPGERSATGGIANAPSYPSTVTMAGYTPPPKEPVDPAAPPAPEKAIASDVNAPTTTIGSSNSFTMTLDYAARSMGLQDEVWNRLQNIHFYWELLDVTGLTPKAAEERDQKTDLGEGEHQHLSGDAAGIRRTMDNIAEDQANDIKMMQDENWSWEARAAYLGVIGLSNTVRAIGSLISSFVSILTRPLNEQSIGFDSEGEFLVRCVATPIPSDKAKEDPDNHVIRASSVAVMPIRVQNLTRRATETLDQEGRQLAELEAAVANARDDKAKALAEAKLAAFRATQRAGGLDTLLAAGKGIREQLRTAEKLQSYKTVQLPESVWELPAINLEIALLTSKVPLADHIKRLRAQLKLVAGEGAKSDEGTTGEGSHEAWARRQAGELKGEVRPRVALASEENGQVTPVLMMLGQLNESDEAHKQWRIVDITSPGSRDFYTGESRLAGPEGHSAAIRDAFRNFAENNQYGRGTIAIRLPAELQPYAMSVPALMRSTPGASARMMQRLKDLATVAEIVGLFVTGPIAFTIGAVGGVAGAVVAVDSLARRARTDHLMEVGTIFDVLGVVGGVASVGGVGAGVARMHVDDLAAMGGRMPTWVNKLERTERALHIHGVIGNVQQVIAIPWQLYQEMEQIEQQLAAGTISEGQARARGALALLNGIKSGAVTIISASGGLARRPTIEPTPDAPGGTGGRPGAWDLPAGFRGDKATANVEGGPAIRPVTEGGGEGAPARGGETPVRPTDESPPPRTGDGGEGAVRRGPSESELVAEALKRAEQTRRASDAAVADAHAVRGEAAQGDGAGAGARVPTPRATPLGEATPGRETRAPTASITDGLATLAARVGSNPDPAALQPRRGTVTPDPDAAAVVRDAADMGGLRRQVEAMPSLTAPQRAAVQARLQEARVAVTNEHVARVLESVQQRFPDLQLAVQDLGTPGFASDRDITVRATPRDPAAYAAMTDGQRQAVDRQMVQASAEAIPLLYASLEAAGLPAQRSLDTNFYTELHEGRIRPTDAAESVRIAADQEIVSMTEVLLNVSPDQWRAYVDGQRQMIERIAGMPDPDRTALRQRFNDQVVAAETNARRLLGDLPGAQGHGQSRDAALTAARDRLVAAMQRDPPPTAQETRQLMADVKLLEPDAYGTRAAVEGVVLGTQGMKTASLEQVRADGFRTQRQIERGEGEPGPLRLDPESGQMVELSAEVELQRRRGMAMPNVGRVRPGAPSAYEINARSLAEAQAVLAHLMGHLPAPADASYGSASTAAKNLGRIASVAEDAGIPGSSGGGLSHLGAIVAAKQAPEPAVPTRDAIRGWARERDVTAWAGREGVPLGTDAEQLAGFIRWSQSEALRLVGAMRTRTGTAAVHDDVAVGSGSTARPTPGDEGPTRPGDGPPPPVVDNGGPATDNTTPRPQPGRGDEADDTRPRPQPGREGEAGGRRRPPPDDEVVDLDDPANQHLTDQMVGMLPDHLQLDRRESELFFDGFVAAHPHLESSLLHNAETGRSLVVQGNAKRSSYTELEARLRELLPADEIGRGRWSVEAHNHPIDPTTGTTPTTGRAASLDDIAGAAHEAAARNGPVTETIRIQTERGPEDIRFGFDPAAERPISIDIPRPDGSREPHRFATIEDYADWYRTRFGRDPGPIPPAYTGPRRTVPGDRSAPTTDIIDTGGEVILRSTRNEFVRQEFFAEDSAADHPFNARYHAHSRLAADGTMTMDFNLREMRGEQMHRSGALRGRQQFEDALAHFRGTIGPAAVRRIRGEWGLGDNLESFQARHRELIALGMSDADARLVAAAETSTGEWATGAGFGRIVNVTVTDDGVTATFEPGASNKPPVPDATGGNVPATRRTPAADDVDEARTRQRGEGMRDEATRQGDVADSAQFRQRLGYVRRRLRSWREEAAADPATPKGTIEMIDGLLVEADRIERGARRGGVDPQTLLDLQADITRYRRQLRRGATTPDRSRQADYEVRIDLSDPAERAEVLRWFEAESTELLGMPLGEHLRTRMLEQLAGLDEIVLQQSPRTAGRDIADTDAMRRRVQEWMDAGRYPPDYVTEFLDAPRGPDGWPRSADGRAWQVDHVLELWAGGEDGPDNYLPLHPDLHSIKSEIWRRFRLRYREQLMEIDQQVDTREHGGLDTIPAPVPAPEPELEPSNR